MPTMTLTLPHHLVWAILKGLYHLWLLKVNTWRNGKGSPDAIKASQISKQDEKGKNLKREDTVERLLL